MVNTVNNLPDLGQLSRAQGVSGIVAKSPKAGQQDATTTSRSPVQASSAQVSTKLAGADTKQYVPRGSLVDVLA